MKRTFTIKIENSEIEDVIENLRVRAGSLPKGTTSREQLVNLVLQLRHQQDAWVLYQSQSGLSDEEMEELEVCGHCGQMPWDCRCGDDWN